MHLPLPSLPLQHQFSGSVVWSGLNCSSLYPTTVLNWDWTIPWTVPKPNHGSVHSLNQFGSEPWHHYLGFPNSPTVCCSPWFKWLFGCIPLLVHRLRKQDWSWHLMDGTWVQVGMLWFGLVWFWSNFLWTRTGTILKNDLMTQTELNHYLNWTKLQFWFSCSSVLVQTGSNPFFVKVFSSHVIG